MQLDRAGDLRRARVQSHDRQRGDRLAGAGLPDDGHRLAGGQVEARDRGRPAPGPASLRERDVQVADLQHGARRWCAGPCRPGRSGRSRRLIGPDPPEAELGSRASRRPSPTAFTQSTSSTTTTAGPANSHGKLLTCRAPSPSSVPSEVSGGWTPKPKNDSPVSARIAPPTLRVASMISSEEMFGRMCRTMVFGPRQAHELGRLDVLALLDRQRQAADHPGRQHPGEGGQQHDQQQPGVGALRAAGGDAPRSAGRPG